MSVENGIFISISKLASLIRNILQFSAAILLCTANTTLRSLVQILSFAL